MSYSIPSWLATHLLAGTPYEGRRVAGCVSAMHLFGSTSGPYAGIAGSAMTYFQMTAVFTQGEVLVFADERLMGWLPLTDAPPIEQVARWLGEVTDRDLQPCLPRRVRLASRPADRALPSQQTRPDRA